MKLSFLAIKTKAYLKRNKAIRMNLPYKQAQNVGVIFSVEDKSKHEAVKAFVKHLEQDGKQVKVISFLPKNKDNYDFMFDFFTERDLSFWGNISSRIIDQFTEKQFDFLYCLDTTPNPLILNLVAKSKAKCRVGKYWEKDQGFFEMMIESQEGVKALIETIYKYTRSVK